MRNKRLAINLKGEIVICTSKHWNVPGGQRCNHILHQMNEESDLSFKEKANECIATLNEFYEILNRSEQRIINIINSLHYLKRVTVINQFLLLKSMGAEEISLTIHPYGSTVHMMDRKNGFGLYCDTKTTFDERKFGGYYIPQLEVNFAKITYPKELFIKIKPLDFAMDLNAKQINFLGQLGYIQWCQDDGSICLSKHGNEKINQNLWYSWKKSLPKMISNNQKNLELRKQNILNQCSMNKLEFMSEMKITENEWNAITNIEIKNGHFILSYD